MKGPCNDEPILYVECDNGYLNLYLQQNLIEHTV